MMGARVLVADDEPQVRRLVSAVLRRDGCEVFEARDGIEALAVASDLDRLDAVISDVEMPYLGGFELIHWIRGRFPNVPALVVTGGDGVTADGGPGLVNAFLRKPFSADDIRAFIERSTATMVEDGGRPPSSNPGSDGPSSSSSSRQRRLSIAAPPH